MCLSSLKSQSTEEPSRNNDCHCIHTSCEGHYIGLMSTERARQIHTGGSPYSEAPSVPQTCSGRPSPGCAPGRPGSSPGNVMSRQSPSLSGPPSGHSASPDTHQHTHTLISFTLLVAVRVVYGCGHVLGDESSKFNTTSWNVCQK